jgi:hypothetical protein
VPQLNVAVANYVVKYNGFQFDPNTTETVSVRSRPVYDSAGRTIVYFVWQFVIRSVIYARKTGDTTTDFQLNSARQLLQSPAGAFQYKDRGFGELEINVGKRQRDVVWGPRPKELSWEPWGDANAGLITWQVEVAIPECNSAKFEGKPMEWNYSVEYDLEDGFTTRKVKGHLVIPQTRDAQGNRRFRHSADEYREKVTPRPQPGFRRMPMTFSLSEDKCRLDFRFEDQEMGEDIPPPGVLRLDADMEAHNAEASAFQQMTYTLRATYEMAPGFPPQLAYAHYQKFALDRQEATKRAAKAGKKGVKGFVRLYWQVREPKIVDRVKVGGFTTTWLVTFAVRDLLAEAFWRPVPDGDRRDWKDWQAKLDDVVTHPRGLAGLQFDPSEDIILDLCQADVPPPRVGKIKNVKVKPLPPGRVGKLRDTSDPDMAEFSQSWRVEAIGSTYIHKPLSDPQTNRLRTPAAGGAAAPNPLAQPALVAGGQVFAPPGTTAIPPDTVAVVGERTAPTYYLIHEGRAVRVGQPFACPVVRRIGPMPVVPCNRRGDGFVGMWGSGLWENLYFCRWRMTYLLPGRPGTNVAGPNPIYNEGPGDHGDDTDTRDPRGEWDAGLATGTSTLRSGGGLPH